MIERRAGTADGAEAGFHSFFPRIVRAGKPSHAFLAATIGVLILLVYFCAKVMLKSDRQSRFQR
jgi:hypothetical protein